MCRYYWLKVDSSTDPHPGDDICGNKNVEAIAGSVMAGLAFLDGIVCTLPRHHPRDASSFREELMYVSGGCSVSEHFVCPEIGRSIWQTTTFDHTPSSGDHLDNINDDSLYA